MSRILSLDPGHTVGVAALDDSGELYFSMAVPKDTIYRNGFLNKLVAMAKPDVVLIENLPKSMVDVETNKVWNHFCHWFKIAGFQIVHINPGQWKGLAKRVEIPGQHARDAATMAKWWLESQKN